MKNLILSISFLLVSVSMNATNTETPKIVDVQKGVTNYQGVDGVYIYYRLPSDANFNVEKHRKFISNMEYFKLVNKR